MGFLLSYTKFHGRKRTGPELGARVDTLLPDSNCCESPKIGEFEEGVAGHGVRGDDSRTWDRKENIELAFYA